MAKTILFLALIALLSPFTTAQFNINFTSVQIGWGSRGVFAVPSNITDPDGTTYFDIERNTLDEPDGEWTLDLYNADGTSTNFIDNNGDLVVIGQDGTQTSLAGQIPPLLGITGGELLQVLENNLQLGVDSVYADPSINNITTAQANKNAQGVVDQVLATSSLPAFFLTTFRAQAYQQISDSLNNAQAVSAAINASLGGNNGSGNNGTGNNGTGVGNSVSIPLNLTSFNFSSLHDVKEIWASYGNETVEAILISEVAGESEQDYVSWLVDLQPGEAVNPDDWALSWLDLDGQLWDVQDINGQIVVIGEDGSETDYTNQADWFVDTEATNGEIGLAIGNSIEDFVDAVVANDAGQVVINVGDDGLNWTYPAVNATS